MRRILFLASLLVWAVVSGACQHDHRPEGTPQQPQDTQAQTPEPSETAVETWTGDLLIDTVQAKNLGYAVRWATDIKLPPGGRLDHVRILGDLVVCAESPSNVVTAISYDDGALVWSRAIGQTHDRLFAPARSGRRVIVNTESQLFTLDAATGQTLNVSPLDTIVTNSPAVVEGYAIFGGMNHRVFAHGIVEGYTKWAYQLTERIFIEPVISGPNVFVVDANGVYAMLTAVTGKLQWKSRIFGRVAAQPVVSPAGVFVACEDNALYAMNRATGRDLWIHRTTQPLTRDLSLVGGMLFLPLPGQGLVALAERTGKELWHLPYEAQPLVQIKDSLLFNDHTRLLNVEAKTGEVVGEAPVQPLMVVLTGKDNQLVLVSKTGRLLRMDPGS